MSEENSQEETVERFEAGMSLTGIVAHMVKLNAPLASVVLEMHNGNEIPVTVILGREGEHFHISKGPKPEEEDEQ